jgi:hypothetical protein
LLKDVPKVAGWYWGRFNDTGWWETVYLGKAGTTKHAKLNGRLCEELKDERLAFWASVYGREAAVREFSRLHKRKYDRFVTRILRKAGAHFVIWVEAEHVRDHQIEKQERMLIQIFRPTHNAVRTNPRYGDRADKLTEDIEDAVAREIREIQKPS